MNDLLKQETHFVFGKNWMAYALKIDEPKIAQAMDDPIGMNGYNDVNDWLGRYPYKSIVPES